MTAALCCAAGLGGLKFGRRTVSVVYVSKWRISFAPCCSILAGFPSSETLSEVTPRPRRTEAAAFGALAHSADIYDGFVLAFSTHKSTILHVLKCFVSYMTEYLETLEKSQCFSRNNSDFNELK